MTTAEDDAAAAEGMRAAERRLLDHYGLTATERTVHVAALGLDVRVLDFPGSSAEPPIVLLHGIASVTAVAMPLVPALGDRRILAPDFPGHGLSDGLVLPSGANLSDVLATVVDAVVTDIGGERVDLVAHSLGGQTALTYALQHPDRVRRLVLLGAPGVAFAGVKPVAAMRIMAMPGIGTAMLSARTSLAAYSKNSEALLGAHALDGFPDEIAEVGWHASRRSTFGRSLASFFRALITPFGLRRGVSIPLARLATIEAPTLMIWGDEDVFLTPAVGRANLDAIPDSRVLIVRGGHAPWLDEPGPVAERIAQFL